MAIFFAHNSSTRGTSDWGSLAYQVGQSPWVDAQYFVGKVVGIVRRNTVRGEELYARVWNSEEKKTELIYVASGREVADVRIEIDAKIRCVSPVSENPAKASASSPEPPRGAGHIHELNRRLVDAPARGTACVVVSGRARNARPGDTGKVFWKGICKYTRARIVVGVTLSSGQSVYLSADAIRAI